MATSARTQFMGLQMESKVKAYTHGVAEAKSRSASAAKLRSVRKSAKSKSFDAGSSQRYLSGYKKGMKGRGGRTRHSPQTGRFIPS